jgi:hypothetical protein
MRGSIAVSPLTQIQRRLFHLEKKTDSLVGM